MDLPEVMILLYCPLYESDSYSFWNLVSIRDKTVKQSQVFFEMIEELSGCSFPTVSETKISNISGESDKLHVVQHLTEYDNDGALKGWILDLLQILPLSV